jgi:valyl-tRNA synthetase
MSKSRGHVIDPLEVMARYGTDAFRFTLGALAAQGRDIRLAEERIEGYRNFANKIWNAARFVLTNLDGYDPRLARKAEPTLAERWILSRLSRTIGAVRTALGAYRFNDAASAIYQFLWHEYCDWYLECAKLTLYRSADPAARARTLETLVSVLETTLRLLHPLMPFITEEVWQRLPHKGDSIMIAPFPKISRKARDPQAEAEMELFMGIVSAIRNIRSEMRVPPAAELRALLKPADRATGDRLTPLVPMIQALARCEASVDLLAARPPASALAVVGPAECFVPLAGLVDLAAERQRLSKEIRKAEDEIRFLEEKLGRPEFRERAPAEVVEREEARLAEQKALRAKLLESLGRMEDAAGVG